MFDSIFGAALVYNVTIAHKDESVEKEEGLRRGRVDRADDSLALIAGKPLQQHANTESFKGVKTRGWLIEQNDRRIRDKLDADGAPLSLSAREDLFLSISDHTVSNVAHAQVLNNRIN